MTSAAIDDPSASRRLLLPREHGAYGQLAFPLATALLVGRAGVAPVALALAAAAAFLAHEPLLVVLGQRGRRASREDGARARRWLAALGGVAAALGLAGLALAPAAARHGALLPLVLAALLAPLVARRQEKTTAGEALAASALAACAVPVALAGGAAPAAALVCWLVWTLAFAVATTAVRSVIARARSAGGGGGARWLVPATVGLALASAGVVAALAARGVAPAAGVWALAPVTAMALGLCAFPPGPRRLKAVGWALVSASAATTAVLALVF